jgi:hypothetical protein
MPATHNVPPPASLPGERASLETSRVGVALGSLAMEDVSVEGLLL